MMSRRNIHILIIGSLVIILQAILAMIGTDSLMKAKAEQFSDGTATVASEMGIRQLAQTTELVVRGSVVSVEARWTQEGLIETVSTIAIRYPLFGVAPVRLQVLTPGGYLPKEDLRLIVSHQPIFEKDQEVLLFLQEAEGGYRVAEDALGLYQIQHQMASNPHLETQMLFTSLLSTVTQAFATNHKRIQLPSNWQAQEEQAQTEQGQATLNPIGRGIENFVFKGYKWPSNEVRFRLNVNTPQVNDGEDGTKDVFINVIKDAAKIWTDLAQADISLVYDGEHSSTQIARNGVNEVMWLQKNDSANLGYAQVWLAGTTLIEADLWFNEKYNWNATGDPEADEFDLETVALHEFGHWLGLGHDPETPAVMYAVVSSGGTKRTLTTADQNGAAFIYPCASQPCNPSSNAATATPTTPPATTAPSAPTATPIVIQNDTATPTATTPAVETPTPAATPTSIQFSIPADVPTQIAITTTEGLMTEFSVPAGAVDQAITVLYRPIQANGSLANLSPTSLGFELVVVSNGASSSNLSLNKPITLTIQYLDETVSNFDESTLTLLLFDSVTQSWKDAACGEYVRLPDSNQLLVTVCSLGQFSLAGTRLASPSYQVYLPFGRR